MEINLRDPTKPTSNPTQNQLQNRQLEARQTVTTNQI